MPGFSFPPDFTIPTRRLQISPFNPTNASHCAFLVQLWNIHNFISSCGKSGITTPEKASSFLRGRVSAQYAYYGYRMFLVSRQFDDGANPIGIVSLLKGIPPEPHYFAPDIGFTILPEESRKGHAIEAAKTLFEYVNTALGVDAV